MNFFEKPGFIKKAEPEETTEEAELPAINPGGKAGQTESAQASIVG